MKLAKVILSLFFLLFVVCQTNVKADPLARLMLNPAAGTYAVGEQFTVGVEIDVDGHTVDAVDAVINYDAEVLNVVGINTTNLFHMYPTAEISGNYITISGLRNIDDPLTTNGVLANIIFEVKQTSVTSTSVLFIVGTDQGSHIAENATAEDVLNDVVNGDYTISQTAVTPTPSSSPATPTPTSSSSPTTLPKSSSELTTHLLTSFLIILLSFGVKFFFSKS